MRLTKNSDYDINTLIKNRIEIITVNYTTRKEIMFHTFLLPL